MPPFAPIAVCSVAVAGLLLAEWRDSERGIWLAKPVASLSFIWMAVASGATQSSYGWLILVALVLCLAGDLLLIPRNRAAVFRAGVLAFLLGHLAYAAGFMTQPLAWPGLAIGAALLTLVVLVVLRWLGPSLPADMVWPVRAYLVVIALMSVLACGFTAAGGPPEVAIGALAFTASDVSVARDRFLRHEFLNRAWGLPLYYAAQMLLASTPALV